MSCLLLIETSTSTCSLALFLNGQSILRKIHTTEKIHSALLGIFAKEAVEHTKKNSLSIEAVAISAGPGSYTGLRIGISLAKGLCYGLNIPLIAIPTLKIMAFQVIHSSRILSDHTIFCPMIDARKMEVFSALYTKNLDEVRGIQVDMIDENSYKLYLGQYQVVFFGNGSDKCRNIIQSQNAVFLKNIYPQIQAIGTLAEIAFKKKEWADIRYFEPFYIKKFQEITK